MKTEQEIINLFNEKVGESNKLKYNRNKKGNKGYRIPFLAIEIQVLKWVLE